MRSLGVAVMVRARNIRKRAALVATSSGLALALVSGCGDGGGVAWSCREGSGAMKVFRPEDN
ncbi:hypothetical protein ACFC58_25570 [Kitasatospora purpeofusca]|uniref:hypothetical protein n=1 Tax=Kitasatospora purpeofusca TaxID=67352 RepID=UPI0035DD9290